MNFIEAVKLLKLDKNIKLMRRTNDFEITYGLIGINLTITDILAEDWYVVKDEKLHTFEEALKALKNGAKIRIISWKSDVYISLQIPDVNSKMTAPYMYVTSRYGQVPWMPTQIEIMSGQWEIKEEKNE